jgi:acyl dehydratase
MDKCDEDGELGPNGAESATATVGPVTPEMVLQMAALTRDYHPIRVVRNALARSGEEPMVLHEVWISGLAAARLGSMAAGLAVTSLELRYHSAVCQGEVLTIRIIPGGAGLTQETETVAFEVLNGALRLVAAGTAELEHKCRGKK